MTLFIDFDNRQEKIAVTYKMKLLVRTAILETLKEENKVGDFAVSVSFVDKTEIKNLNKQFRKTDKVTDVLSFPLINFDEPPVLDETVEMGDIVLCIDKAKEQAKEFGHPIEREIAYLTCHSTLHLLGYDHELGEAQDKEMREKQNLVMKTMGLEV